VRLRGVSRTEGIEDFASRSIGLHTHLVRVVFGVTADRTVAEDAAQEALARLWEQVQRDRPPDDERAWVTQVALNWARSGFRRRAAEGRAMQRLRAAQGQSQRPGADADPLSADLRVGLLALPYRQREVAVLHYLEDMDVASVAAATGSSVGSVKNALFHARKALAQSIAPANHRADPDRSSGSLDTRTDGARS